MGFFNKLRELKEGTGKDKAIYYVITIVGPATILLIAAGVCMFIYASQKGLI